MFDAFFFLARAILLEFQKLETKGLRWPMQPLCGFGSRSKSERCLDLLLTSSSFSVCDFSRVTVVLSSVFSSSNCCTLGKGGQECQKWRIPYNLTVCSNSPLPGGYIPENEREREKEKEKENMNNCSKW